MKQLATKPVCGVCSAPAIARVFESGELPSKARSLPLCRVCYRRYVRLAGDGEMPGRLEEMIAQIKKSATEGA